MKSRFRSAMKSKLMPWLNMTKRFDSGIYGNLTGQDLQFNILEALTNLAEFTNEHKEVIFERLQFNSLEILFR